MQAASASAEVSGGNNRPRTQSRHYCFTSYRGEIPYNPKSMKYLCQAPELCPTTGRPHHQGYVIFRSERTRPAVRKELPNIDIDIMVSTPSSCIAYIEGPYDDGNGKTKPKNEHFVEYGDRPCQGKRNDIKSITQDIYDGTSNMELLLKHGDKALRMHRAIDWARSTFNNEKRDWEMDVRIYWGPPGGGKTRDVWEEFGVDNVYPKMVGKWWDNYKGEQCVLIDDFDPLHCFDIQFDFYLKLLDRYPFSIEWKGGSGQFLSRTIIFTSNFNPDSWWVTKENRSAFFRRVKAIRFYCGCADAGHGVAEAAVSDGLLAHSSSSAISCRKNGDEILYLQ